MKQLDSIQARLKGASDARAKDVASGEISYSGNVDFDALTDESISKLPTEPISFRNMWSRLLPN